MDNLNKDKRVIIIQGEILALLHDIGKLNWEFYYYAAHSSLLKDLNEQVDKKRKNLLAIHTQNFLDNFSLLECNSGCSNGLEVQNLLKKKMQGWLGCEDIFATDLSALLATHHNYKLADEHFNTSQKIWPTCLIMYADTADSLFSKGDSSESQKKAQAQMKALSGENEVFLSGMFGANCRTITRDNLAPVVTSFMKELTNWINDQIEKGVLVWSEGNEVVRENIKEFSYEDLLEAKNSLVGLLKKYTKESPAETRVPNNDVTLWQHSRSTASIFKALLAEYVYSNNWESILQNDELCHAKQKLSLLGIRWDEEAFLAKSLRAHEIEARELALKHLREDICNYVENELALGNAIYEDSTGICFLVPELQNPNNSLEEILQRLINKIEELSNSSDFEGTLPWRIEQAETGLRLVSFDSFWNNDSEAKLLADGPIHPKWIEKTTGTQVQICPRCGFHTIPGKLAKNRTGSSNDAACLFCISLSKTVSDNPDDLKKHDTFFGVTDETKSFRLPYKEENPDENLITGSRFALIQGFIPREILCSGSFFQEVLKNDTNWESDFETLKKNWRTLRSMEANAELNEEQREYFRELLGAQRDLFAKFGNDGEIKDGWSSGAECMPPPQGKYSAGLAQEYIRFLVLDGKNLNKKIDEKELEKETEAILLWGKGQFAAPSRLMRLWETMDEFFKIPFSGAFKDENGEVIPICPLSRDSNSFRLIVNSADVLPFVRALREEYARCIGPFRHKIPLHISATVFRKGSPVYIAMDAARRFANIAKINVKAQEWKIESIDVDEKTGNAKIQWDTPSGLEKWEISGIDPFRGWFRTNRDKDGSFIPIHIYELKAGDICQVIPSTFDYEVLDSSIRRYDIRYDKKGKRKHYMSGFAKPRAYSLGILDEWNELEAILNSKDVAASQLKTCQELLCRIHFDWARQYKNENQRNTFERFVEDILINTLGRVYTDCGKKDIIRKAAINGSFFDLCEWMTFLNK